MSERTTGRMPRKYSKAMFKNKQDAVRYKKLADKIMSQSRVYEKERKIAIIGIVICVLIMVMTPLIIYFKCKKKMNKGNEINGSAETETEQKQSEVTNVMNQQMVNQQMMNPLINTFNDII